MLTTILKQKADKIVPTIGPNSNAEYLTRGWISK
jgi:hypothetical protein